MNKLDLAGRVAIVTGGARGIGLAVRVRAVTPGRFELPGMEAQDMYRPGVFARQNTGRVVVYGPDDALPPAQAPAPQQRPAPAPQRPQGTR